MPATFEFWNNENVYGTTSHVFEFIGDILLRQEGERVSVTLDTK